MARWQFLGLWSFFRSAGDLFRSAVSLEPRGSLFSPGVLFGGPVPMLAPSAGRDLVDIFVRRAQLTTNALAGQFEKRAGSGLVAAQPQVFVAGHGGVPEPGPFAVVEDKGSGRCAEVDDVETPVAVDPKLDVPTRDGWMLDRNVVALAAPDRQDLLSCHRDFPLSTRHRPVPGCPYRRTRTAIPHKYLHRAEACGSGAPVSGVIPRWGIGLNPNRYSPGNRWRNSLH